MLLRLSNGEVLFRAIRMHWFERDAVTEKKKVRKVLVSFVAMCGARRYVQFVPT